MYLSGVFPGRILDFLELPYPQGGKLWPQMGGKVWVKTGGKVWGEK